MNSIEQYAEEMRNEINALPAPQDGESTDWWNDVQQEIRQLAAGDANLVNFHEWSGLCRTMGLELPGYSQRELPELKMRSDWKTRILPALKDVGGIGIPKLPEGCAPNSVHHMYHMTQFEKVTHRRIEDMAFVFEFGPGYGNICRIVHNLGFSGIYAMYDLPELKALQKFYLKTSQVPFSDGKSPGAWLLDSMNAVKGAVPAQDSCMVSTWAIEESVPELMKQFDACVAHFDHFLLADGGGHGFISGLQKRHTDVCWTRWEIPFLKGHHYMMGVRKGGQ